MLKINESKRLMKHILYNCRCKCDNTKYKSDEKLNNKKWQ